MSQSAVEQVLGRMLLHPDFRQSMQSEPRQALAGYDLTEGEIEAFIQMDLEDFSLSATGLDERISKAWNN